MYGVSRITSAEDVMMISYVDVEPLFLTKTLNALAGAGVVVDMISQTPAYGAGIRFSFTAAASHAETALKALGGEQKAPMISSGYTKLNLYGEEMVESLGVAARALAALGSEQLEIAMITTSDLDISLLMRQEYADVALDLLRNAFEV